MGFFKCAFVCDRESPGLPIEMITVPLVLDIALSNPENPDSLSFLVFVLVLFVTFVFFRLWGTVN